MIIRWTLGTHIRYTCRDHHACECGSRGISAAHMRCRSNRPLPHHAESQSELLIIKGSSSVMIPTSINRYNQMSEDFRIPLAASGEPVVYRDPKPDGRTAFDNPRTGGTLLLRGKRPASRREDPKNPSRRNWTETSSSKTGIQQFATNFGSPENHRPRDSKMPPSTLFFQKPAKAQLSHRERVAIWIPRDSKTGRRPWMFTTNLPSYTWDMGSKANPEPGPHSTSSTASPSSTQTPSPTPSPRSLGVPIHRPQPSPISPTSPFPDIPTKL